ncbi:RNA pyrophosphohydrolase [Pseudoalteromonas holothuriae]|uniref:RNA pyrophosphohydrolase n=1 Tax=Pseudoalteromonas holothuriae TaxID=2963714 RepID=A0A9W4VM44_9GAMM|nr:MULTISPECIES: NUDIX domain-containing protein [unclassified Pseudoalteromonas]CAH9049465.1 RNA pyrophosphohydrolase [Pseudoalteromonas sp. CIP111854]CAH9055823.1 RNA pyrophosphohydrolase [Pseudoalteromonas sp. CIP111951]
MQQLNPTTVNTLPGTHFTRHTTRAIVLDGEKILLLYTARYDDYSLPGGGIDKNETIEQALLRELQEETGVESIVNIREFGRYEEYRVWYKHDYDNIHIISNCYICEICGQFNQPQMEDYEQANGMKPVWVNINEAIAHNQRTLKNSEKKGQSLIRELYLLQKIKTDLM